MSHEPEDSPLEEALRADLPSADTEARLRRRLLAAGILAGNGIAATTAAAAGSGGGTAATSTAALSWAVKLGLAAAVAIPTFGLLLDEAVHGRGAASPALVASPARAARSGSSYGAGPGLDLRATPAADLSAAAPPNASALAEPSAGRRERQAGTRAATALESPPRALPSQSTFAAEAPPPATSPARSTLAAETRLLDAAFAELAAGNRARAGELIAEHESRYPQGLLKQERERAKQRLSELSRGE